MVRLVPFLMFFFGFAPAFADLPPRKGRKRIPVLYKVKLGTSPSRVLVQVSQSALNPSSVDLKPLRLGVAFAPLSGYRTETWLVAFSKEEAAKVLSLAKNHPDLSKQRDKLSKVKDPLRWIRGWSYQSLGGRGRKPDALTSYLVSAKRTRSEGLATKTEVDSDLDAKAEIRSVEITALTGNKVSLKASRVLYRNHSGRMVRLSTLRAETSRNKRFRVLLWVVVGLLLSGAGLFLSLRRRSGAEGQEG